MSSKRRGREPAWSRADAVADARRRPRRRHLDPEDQTQIAGSLIALAILAGAGLVVWQLVSFLRG